MFLAALLAADPTLYERLGLAKGASVKEIKKAYHLAALKSHPDKVDGGPAAKEKAAEEFKAVSQAYEVLSNAELRRSYDATGRVPDDKAYNAAQKQRPDGEDEYGYEGGSSSSGYQQRYSQRGYRFYSNYDEFAVKLAIGRARRVRSLSALKALLQDPNGRPVKVGLVGFYAAGDADSLKRLRSPYPFAGWSDPHQGAGFWWEDAIQTCLVSVGTTNLESELLRHFGITGATKLPVVAWVKKDAALTYDDVSMAGFVHETFVSWVYERLHASVKIVNDDFRDAKIWWISGGSAKEMGVAKARGGTFEHSTFLSHKWVAWPVAAEGRVLGVDSLQGSLTIENLGELHTLHVKPKCLDKNGHCGQWKGLGECEKNAGYMAAACARSCGGCDGYDWLFELGLGELHERVRCWEIGHAQRQKEGHCAAHKRQGGSWPPHQPLRSQTELRKLSALARTWLERSADEINVETRRALDAAFLPPRPPPRPPPRIEEAPPPPPPKSEL